MSRRLRQCLHAGPRQGAVRLFDLEGEIVKARLEGEGIPVLLKGGGSDPYGMGVAYVFVPTEFEAQARLVLEDVSDETT